jgi:hypothetical protein
LCCFCLLTSCLVLVLVEAIVMSLFDLKFTS